MPDVLPGDHDGAHDGPASDRLESWKEIAAYLKRDVTTVQRWEKREALPVRRLVHERQGSVYAYRAELDAWRTRHEGQSRSPSVTTVDPPGSTSRQRRVLLLGSALVATTAVAVAAFLRISSSSLPSPPLIRTVGVLPLSDITAARENRHFAEGLTHALTHAFAQLLPVTVMSSESMMGFAGSSLTPRDISRQLGGVDGLVEGTVARTGNRVQLTVALVHAETGRRLWTTTVERELGDLGSAYTHVAHEAARDMGVVVQETAGRAYIQTVDPSAYDSYLKGVYFTNRWMAGGCLDAEPHLKLAAEHDRRFALPHALLAFCYAFPARTGRQIEELGPKAWQAAETAIALDDRLGLGYAMRAVVKAHVRHDIPGALADFERALTLDPTSDRVLVGYGELLNLLGQHEKGISLIAEAVRLNPLSPDRQVAFAFNLLQARRFDMVIEQMTRWLEHSDSPGARQMLVEAYTFKGALDAAFEQYLKWLEATVVTARRDRVASEMREIYAMSGWNAVLRRDLELALEERATPGSVWKQPFSRAAHDPFNMARRYARLRDIGRTLEWLERAERERSHLIVSVRVNPTFEFLRADHRFQRLVRRVGLTAANVSVADSH